jgi:hypothetical protein
LCLLGQHEEVNYSKQHDGQQRFSVHGDSLPKRHDVILAV